MGSEKIKQYFFTTIYCITYILSYVFFLNPAFEYFGFVLYEKDLFFMAFSCVIAVIPIIFYRGYKSISSTISVFIYILVYVPTILTFALGLNVSIFRIIEIQFLFCSMMCLFFIADRFVFIRNFDNQKFAFISARFFLILTIILTIYVLYIYKGNLAFVNIRNVYEHRFANKIIGSDVVSRYLLSWLSTFFIPVCLIYGLMNKKKMYFIVGTAACIVVYMATAAKSALLLPFFLYGLYVLISRYGVNQIYSTITLLLSFAIIALLLISPQKDTLLSYFSSLLMWRIVGCGGHLNLWYYDFFSDNPLTYYSHVGPINFFTESYPYGNLDVGQVVGSFYWHDKMNANANFWATDGIAAYGLTGVIIVSLVLFFIMVLLNTITKKFDKRFILLLFIPFISTLLNTSLFSTMWSGGGIFLIIFLLFCKKEFYSNSNSKKYITTNENYNRNRSQTAVCKSSSY